MKRITFPALFLLLLTLVQISCKEDTFIDWKILNDNWYEKHKTDKDYKITESGLCYRVIEQGKMRRPNSSSNVTVKYTGKLINGIVFDKSDSFQTNLSQVIKGWTEGITKMNVGGHYLLYIPADLAYGKAGRGNIPPYSVLIFDITLIASEDQLY